MLGIGASNAQKPNKTGNFDAKTVVGIFAAALRGLKLGIQVSGRIGMTNPTSGRNRLTSVHVHHDAENSHYFARVIALPEHPYSQFQRCTHPISSMTRPAKSPTAGSGMLVEGSPCCHCAVATSTHSPATAPSLSASRQPLAPCAPFGRTRFIGRLQTIHPAR